MSWGGVVDDVVRAGDEAVDFLIVDDHDFAEDVAARLADLAAQRQRDLRRPDPRADGPTETHRGPSLKRLLAMAVEAPRRRCHAIRL